MPKLKLMMIVNTASEAICEYFPSNSPIELVNEMKEVSNGMKNIIFKGKIETKVNKFSYQQYMVDKDYNSSNNQEDDKLVIFLCSEKDYKDNELDKIMDEMVSCINPQSYESSKVENATKNNLAKIFIKYKDFQKLKQNNDYSSENLEFASMKEFASLGINSNKENKEGGSYSFPGVSDTLDENDLKKSLKGSDLRSPNEINNIKKWRKLKCIYLIITLLLLIAVGFSFYFILDKFDGEIIKK